MAQVIAPEVWQEGIDDNRLLPGRYTTGLFIGNTGCTNIANNPGACRVWDIQVTDYITTYDDRRLNGLKGTNTEGRDGWGASAYGVFQDVRFDSRVYTMGRHRSIAMRLFDEMQYGGPIGTWGNEHQSTVKTNGQALMKTAQLLSKAKTIWEAEILGPDIDAYNLFAIMNGHISGRWVANNEDHVMIPDASTGQWVAQPGMVEGQPIQPRFAPIHCIEWQTGALAQMLNAIKVAWNNMFLPQDNRVIIIDPYYEYELLTALTGNIAGSVVPATEAAYSDIQNGSFTRLMGWDFNFEIPSQYFPKLYVDKNLNVVHSQNGTDADRMYVNSVSGGTGADKLFIQLAEAHRMGVNNFVRTEWNGTAFVKTLTNYPLGQPMMENYPGLSATTVATGASSATAKDSKGTTKAITSVTTNATKVDDAYDYVNTGAEGYPFTKPGAGYGMTASGPDLAEGGATLVPVIGCAIYKKAAQLSQEYSEMVTDEGKTRGKFTEMCMDVKYDAWVIESLSHGIMPIIKNQNA